jgi:Xaa-Pro aminopeptidase
MRRGLISRSKAELPDAVLDARIARVRAAMGAAGLDALLLYTNNTRAAGVSWLTGFVPYWSEALLVVPRDREPVLVAALSYRVKSWIERTSRLAEVIHGPRIGLEAAKLIAGWKGDAAVGIADFDGLAAGIVEDLRRGGPRLSLSDATALFAPARAEADPWPRPPPQAHRGRGRVGRTLRATCHRRLQGRVDSPHAHVPAR